jgi:cytochrome c553
MRHTRFLTLVSLVPALAATASAQAPDRRQLEFFEKKIRPVLVKSCYECHSAKSKELGGKLRLDHRMGLLKGGETGAAVVPGQPAASLLLEAIQYRDGLEMPPDEKLSADVIRDFRRWISDGAADPRIATGTSTSPKDAPPKPSKDLWSLKPVRLPAVPEVKNSDWPRSEIDRFLLARMQARGLEPVEDAAPRTLLRRLHFDLIGLPPTPEQSAQFQADHSPQAYHAAVDRLLDSPQFAERWARHWLDAARYAESAGSSRDVLMIWAWRYRNWVIDAVNDDVPYDRFLTEQLAGDLLEATTPDEARRLKVATGLLAIGQKSLNGGNIPLDVIDDQLDVIGKTMLGLTIACARCHDHKFDPIPTADYYALAGIFRSTETLFGGNTSRPKTLDAKLKVYLALGDTSQLGEIRTHQKKLAGLQKQRNNLAKRKAALDKRRNKPAATTTGSDKDNQTAQDNTSKTTKKTRKKPREGKKQNAQADSPKLEAQYQSVVKRLKALNILLARLKATKQPTMEFAIGVRDRGKIADGAIQVRGDKRKAGPIVPRGFLSAVPVADPPRVNNRQSGRLELANWLTRADNPLTPRVAVNRIWAHLLGSGLVATVDNFGHLGQPPSHPQLLDWLAHRFVNHHRWSRKAMIREVVLSRAYQLASSHNPAAFQADPAARFVWRHNRRRLEAEAIRDAMLFVSGSINLTRPHASQVTLIGEGEVGRNLNTKPLTAPFSHRSVYLPIVRGILPEFLKLFDFPDPSNPQSIRDQTNTPGQSLYLLNSPFAIEQSDALADRLLARTGNDADRVDRAFQITYGRHATSDETDRSLNFITTVTKTPSDNAQPAAGKASDTRSRRQHAWSQFCQVLLAAAEFRYLD